jgi:hypothetical protein
MDGRVGGNVAKPRLRSKLHAGKQIECRICNPDLKKKEKRGRNANRNVNTKPVAIEPVADATGDSTDVATTA